MDIVSSGACRGEQCRKGRTYHRSRALPGYPIERPKALVDRRDRREDARMNRWRILAWATLLLGCNRPTVVGTGPGAGAGGGGGGGGAAAVDAAGAGPGARDAGFGFVVPEAGPPAEAATGCVNLQCQQRPCPGGGSTTASGTVYAPNGKLPLYNVAVYVPNGELAPLPLGMTCDRCGTMASGRPIASALTDHQGKFRVTNVPVGKDIPIVFQVGKWRRRVVIPEVRACQDNPLADPQSTRLPRNRGEGDLPRVALTTGACDQLTCMVPKLGLDPSEVGVSGQDRAFTFFSGADGNTSGGPSGMRPATTLWSNYDELARYDMVLLSCPCTEHLAARGPAALEALTRYVNAGGRTFGSHFEYVWLKHTPDAALRAAFSVTGGGELGAPPVTLDTTFPKGKALADWMKFLDPGLTYGQVPTMAILDSFSSARAPAQVWARSPGFGTAQRGPYPRFVTINTPVSVPAEQRCGRMAHLDVHVTADSGGLRPPGMGMPAPNFPASCGSLELTKSEHALAFFIFDLAACIQEDTTPPVPPVIIP
jgi:hypothetical protein